jgi:DNA-binding MarR family transcriptional regulator/GNAT superfamily N-acetyltransferase
MTDPQVLQVRRFNRAVTRRIGALEESYLSRGRPLAEARLIFEVGVGGAETRDLRAALGLDSGYLSRLVRSLEAQGLVEVGKQPGDARVRRVILTDRGRRELDCYERLSDELAQSMLAPLGASERERLVAAMSDVERLIRAAEIAVAVESPRSAAARWCLGEYYRELARRFEAGFDPEKGRATRDEEIAPPAGYFFVARLEGRPAGCGALLRVDTATGEIKRMWTAPDARGLGVARRIIATIEATARDSGMRTLRLDTNRALKEAHALYRKLGFEEVAAFNDNPYAHHWFQKRI